MDILKNYDVNEILMDLERCLNITSSDYKEPVDIIVTSVKDRLSRQYAIDLSMKVNEIQQGTGSIDLLVDAITLCHGILSGYFHTSRYHKRMDISLTNVNYLGFSTNAMLEFLIALQTYQRRNDVTEAIEAVKLKVSKTTICNEKRFLVLLIVCYELGFYELTGCIAEILYMGGIST